MKSITVILLMFLVIPKAFSQADTISVSDQSTIYLTFEEAVDLINIGNKDFAQKVEGNIVMLKAVVPSSGATTLLIRSGEFVGSFYLKYERSPSKTFYDFRRMSRGSSGGSGRTSEAKESKVPDLKTTEERAKKVLSYPTRFKSYGYRTGGVFLSILDVVIDKKIMYVKLGISNKSSVDYNVDYVSFQIKKGGKGFMASVSSQNVAVEAVYGIAPESIKASESGVFVYALPLYAGSVGSDLVVTSRETDGGRTLTGSIPYKVINKANKY